MIQENWWMYFIHQKKMNKPKRKVKWMNPNEIEAAETNEDGNNTEEQKRLGIDIQMIGARKEELGRTRSQTKN